ncbi:MFS transporter (plasmid) [Rhodococcus pyridinivorans]|jgi:MFS family permease|uniref:MFS transporter n=2 Tax=Actinomycetes TaxID=1760 RepID=UPI0003692A51|nr:MULTISPECIES: MFS transporter [Mycobacteriales]PZT88419.1 MAG: MFS transporter [Gordonia sp. (in: high G+C Gram-positive bacteria)]MBN0973737.1 MFS transporter [Gordonia sp. BP-119]MBN0985085.1 MFS transporter [Gordonia sp. BP-94]MCT7294179.1 MFS transporter [Rhodococcus sp. PAE-6]UQB75734.1 MFS transporter [Rhodococcus ruber]
MDSVNYDRALSALAIILFSFALGTLSVVVPLLGVHAGYTPSEIGLLVAVAAIAQLITRLYMGALMRRIPDRSFLVGSGLMIAISCALLAISPAVVFFVASQLVQGIARAFFWTSSQTHAVRTSAAPVSGLRDVNLAAGIGALLGPTVAGYLWEASVQLPLMMGIVAGSVAVVPAALLIRFPPFAARPSSPTGRDVRLWRRPGVNAACWMNTGAGVWKSLLDSYVPLALSLAGQPAAVIGILLSIANATVLVGSTASGWVRRRGVRASLVIGMIATGLGLAAVGPFAGLTAPVAIALAISGIGAGVLQTVGPAIAAEKVHPEERGDALALTGTFRATALFLSPLGMAGLVTLVPVTAALLAAGLLIITPAATTWRSNKDVD